MSISTGTCASVVNPQSSSGPSPIGPVEDALLLLRDRRIERGSFDLELSLAVGLTDDPSE